MDVLVAAVATIALQNPVPLCEKGKEKKKKKTVCGCMCKSVGPSQARSKKHNCIQFQANVFASDALKYSIRDQ